MAKTSNFYSPRADDPPSYDAIIDLSQTADSHRIDIDTELSNTTPLTTQRSNSKSHITLTSSSTQTPPWVLRITAILMWAAVNVYAFLNYSYGYDANFPFVFAHQIFGTIPISCLSMSFVEYAVVWFILIGLAIGFLGDALFFMVERFLFHLSPGIPKAKMEL